MQLALRSLKRSVARHLVHPTRWDASAPVFMQRFAEAVGIAAARGRAPMVAALLTHQVAVLRGLSELAQEEASARRLLFALYDDFQHRVLAVLDAVADRVAVL